MIEDSPIAVADKKKIVDTFGRTFKTLRVSLTNTCNLACTYCIDPNEKATLKNEVKPKSRKATLSNEQYIKVVDTLNDILEFDTIRLTGGEPMLYKEIAPLIKGIKSIGVDEVKMTTNATLLAEKATQLKEAGLNSINVSLDTINSDISFVINKRTKLQKVLAGIDKATEAGIQVKINSVVIKGTNHQQIIKLLDYCKERNITVRFLELMQMGHLHHNFEQLYFSEADILETISKHYNITPVDREPNATAKYWITDSGYKFGIISNVSSPFCGDCNRLRLDSYGNIYGCLSDNNPINVLDCIDDDIAIREKLLKALNQKKSKFSGSNLSMLHIGG